MKLPFSVGYAVQFENSLGRVTSSSVHNPRQIIDIRRSSSHDSDEAQATKEVRRFKELMLDIEQVTVDGLC